MKTRSMIKIVTDNNNEVEEDNFSEHTEESQETKELYMDTSVFQKCYDMIPYNNYVTEQVYTLSLPYVFWFLLHYCSVHLYTSYCVPFSFKGFLWSPLLISSPHCKAFRWIIHYGGDSIDSMWIMLGTWLSFKILQIWKTTKEE